MAGITDPEKLREVVAQDCSYISGELESGICGICGIAVPFTDANARIIAAMNVSLTLERGVETRAVKKYCRN